MKLVKVRIRKYKSIEDSEEWRVNDVTCLVGKNEAGKSALLEALHKLNPDDSTAEKFVDEDYPRRFALTPQGEEDRKTANVLITTWKLDESDCDFINNEIPGLSLTTESEIVVEKGYDNTRRWTVPADEAAIVAALVARARLDAAESASIKSAKTITSLIQLLSAIATKTEKHKALEQEATKLFPDKSALKAIANKLADRLPTFLYFKEYYKLPGRVSINDLVARRSDPSRYTFGYKVFDALLALVGTTAEQISKAGSSEQLIMRLEAISNRLTNTIFKYWTQNRHLAVRFSFDHAQPKDPPPYNEGWVFSTRIWNQRHQASVSFDQRSTGFIWFFSFLIWFSEVREQYGENLLILLDEPGLTLHGKAQKDLLTYINNELRPNYQLIYTTHSPFMLDAENIFDLRTVQDVVKRKIQGDEVFEEIKGTKVSDRILSRDPDTLLPLQGVAGFDIAQTMFLGPYVLVVEGPSEHAYIQWFSRALLLQGRENLDLQWAIAPAEGATKVSSFVSLFSGRGLRIAALMDYHDGQKKLVNELEASGLLPDGHVLKTTEFSGQAESDIEDMIGWSLYRHLVNHAMNLHSQIAIIDDESKVGNKRVVKYVEEKFRTMPQGVAEFDHYKPAEYLLRIDKAGQKGLPGLDKALSRFEQLFKRINGLGRQT